MDVLNLNGVSKQYKDFKLDHVSFALPQGAIMGLIGENGAGKTTTIKLILNMICCDGGTIDVFGLDHIEQEVEIKEQVGVVMEEVGFNPALNARNVAAIMRGIYRSWDDALYQSYLRKFSLPEGKAIKQYSRGMKMKLSIAAALSHHPRLLILDEATSGLDPVIRNEILDEFFEFIQDETHSVLISSHITSDLEKIADYITFLHGGKVVLSESKDKLLYEYGIVRCGNETFKKFDPKDLIGWRESKFGTEAMVADKETFRQQYDDVVIDGVTLEDIMLFYAKGAEQ